MLINPRPQPFRMAKFQLVLVYAKACFCVHKPAVRPRAPLTLACSLVVGIVGLKQRGAPARELARVQARALARA